MGPLSGAKVIEIAAIGAVPMACMMFADLGATVLHIERTEPSGLGLYRPPQFDLMLRGRQSVAINLKSEAGKKLVLDLISEADAVVEGFRPGVMERLGLGPEICLARNPKLVYGRMTGWGQDGPLAMTAAHDINYVSLSGILDALGPKDGVPIPPLNLVGDYGGALFLVIGVLSALWEAQRSGKGQVIDAAMLDAANLLTTNYHGYMAAGVWKRERGMNLQSGDAFYYGVYKCADDKEIAVGAVEEKFYKHMLKGFGLDPSSLPPRDDRSRWKEGRELLAARIKTKSRDAWCKIFEGTDSCVSPVLSFDEAVTHPHTHARDGFIEVGGFLQPAPAPRFSRTKAEVSSPPPVDGGKHPERVLPLWGFDADAIEELQKQGAFR